MVGVQGERDELNGDSSTLYIEQLQLRIWPVMTYSEVDVSALIEAPNRLMLCCKVNLELIDTLAIRTLHQARGHLGHLKSA